MGGAVPRDGDPSAHRRPSVSVYDEPLPIDGDRIVFDSRHLSIERVLTDKNAFLSLFSLSGDGTRASVYTPMVEFYATTYPSAVAFPDENVQTLGGVGVVTFSRDLLSGRGR